MRQERFDFRRSELDGMPLAVESDEASNPVDVCLLRADAVVPKANGLPDLIEQAGAGVACMVDLFGFL